MKSPLASVHMPCRRRGTALVVTLLLVVILSILVVAFTVEMRMDRMASSSMADNENGKLLVRSAMAHASSLLINNIPSPARPDVDVSAVTPKNWYVNPGRLTVVDDAGKTSVIPLYSGEASGTDSTVAVNINAPSPTTGRYPITGANDPMWVSWVNVLQDATADASGTNRIVGRYAFWIDDESSKINFNVARGKDAASGTAGVLPPGWHAAADPDMTPYLTPTFASYTGTSGTTYGLGHPASINLDRYSEINIPSLASAVYSNGFFKDPEAIKRYVQGDSDSFYEQHKFCLTPFSRSPEFNVFGKPRLCMANPSDLELGPAYQHFWHSKEPLYFWANYGGHVGDNTSADANDMRLLREPVVDMLANMLGRSDWPGFPGKKFRWASTSDAETDQVAVNIAHMGYWGPTSAANPSDMTNMMFRWGSISGAYASDGTVKSPNTSLWKGPESGKPILPVSYFPQLNEIAVHLLPVKVGSKYCLQIQIQTEFYVPPSCLTTTGTSGNKVWSNTGANNYLLAEFPSYMSIAAASGGGTKLNTATYATITSTTSQITGEKAALPAEMPLNAYSIRALPGMYVSNGTLPVSGTSGAAQFSGETTVSINLRFGVGNMNSLALTQMVPIDVPPAEGCPSTMSAGTDDQGTLQFTFTIPGPPLAPDYVLGYTQSYQVSDPRLSGMKAAWARTDTDSLGDENMNSAITANVASKWAAWNFGGVGRTSSIGMFGFVPVGMRSTTSGSCDTLHFRPGNSGSTDLPDWLVLDLLAPSFSGTTFSPVSSISYMNSTAGKINLNSKIYPSGNAYFTPPERTDPLRALFYNMPRCEQVLTAISQFQQTNAFDYVGRICEVPGVADTGDCDFNKELLVRNLASLMTTQSNTFGVWGVAQTVRKRSGNTNYGVFETGDSVTCEKRFYAVVERYVWPGKDGVAGNGQIGMSGTYAKTAYSSYQKSGYSPGDPPSSKSTGSGSQSWKDAASKWADIDGPQVPESYPMLGSVGYAKTPLADANNPLAPVMKYRVIYFKYLP